MSNSAGKPRIRRIGGRIRETNRGFGISDTKRFGISQQILGTKSRLSFVTLCYQSHTDQNNQLQQCQNFIIVHTQRHIFRFVSIQYFLVLTVLAQFVKYIEIILARIAGVGRAAFYFITIVCNMIVHVLVQIKCYSY